jgi:DNA-binding response OmpR family regulator
MRGLNEGADAYLTKPVEIGVLAATLHSLARRIGSVEEEVQVELGRWMLHADGWSMGSPCGAMVALTGNERRLMKSLFHADGSVMKREALLEALSTDGGLDIDPHRLDSVIHRLRSKVARHTSAPFPLLAVYGEGYVLRTV